MDDLFERLRELSDSGVLPYEQDQAVRAPGGRLVGLLRACCGCWACCAGLAPAQGSCSPGQRCRFQHPCRIAQLHGTAGPSLPAGTQPLSPAAAARPQVRALLRQRDAGWKEAEAPSAAPPAVPLPQRVAGGEEAEDWRAVLDKKAAGAGSAAAVQDSARGAPAPEPEAAPGGEAAVAEQQQGAAAEALSGAAEQQASSEAAKKQAVQQLVAAAPANAPWDVAALVQAAREQPALDLPAPADAERLAAALLDHAAASAAAASGSGEADPLRELPAALVGCAALLAELAGPAPAVGEAAAAHLVAAFRKRGEARSREARAQLGQQMLLAGSLAQRGALPEAQLQTMLEQLARQVGTGLGCCDAGGLLSF